MSGDDDDKIQLLQNLAETDFITAERIDFADKINIVYANLTAAGYIHKSLVNEYFDMNVDFFLNEMEKQLPPIFKFKGGLFGKNIAISQKFPDAPLFVLTFLMENEFGEMRPFTKPENKEWYQSEKIRINTT